MHIKLNDTDKAVQCTVITQGCNPLTLDFDT